MIRYTTQFELFARKMLSKNGFRLFEKEDYEEIGEFLSNIDVFLEILENIRVRTEEKTDFPVMYVEKTNLTNITKKYSSINEVIKKELPENYEKIISYIRPDYPYESRLMFSYYDYDKHKSKQFIEVDIIYDDEKIEFIKNIKLCK